MASLSRNCISRLQGSCFFPCRVPPPAPPPGGCENHETFQSLSFPICKMGIGIIPSGGSERRGSNSTQSGGLTAICAALGCFGHVSFPQCLSSSETPAKGQKNALRTFLIEIHTHLQVSHYTSVFCFRDIATQVLCRNSVFFNPSGHN